jgi:hypothetical protein
MSSQDNSKSGHSNSISNGVHIRRNVVMENIKVATSISNAVVDDDGSITPTPTTTVTSTVFENGISHGSVRSDPMILTRHNININNPLGDFDNLEKSTSPDRNLNPSDSQNHENHSGQQQHQRQRELYYENANAVLVPPLNFAMVAPGVYRSGHPNKHNFPFLEKLGLKVIV